MAEPEVHDIIKRAANNDPAAFRSIVMQNQSFLYSVAYRFLGNPSDAEDAVQETFVKLWKNLSRYNYEIKLSTWLYKIVVNICLDVLKSSRHIQRKNLVDIHKESSIAYRSGADDPLHAEELHTLIQEAASKLTPKQKAVFILRDLEGLPVDEVCGILSMSAGNVKSNLYYARVQMSEKLKKYYQTDNINTL